MDTPLSLSKNGHHTLFMHRSQLAAGFANRHKKGQIIGVDQSAAADADRDPPLLPNQRQWVDFWLYDTAARKLDACGDILAVPSGDDCVIWSSRKNVWDICYKTPGGKVATLALAPNAVDFWAGTCEGKLFQVDVATRHMTAIRHDAHRAPVTLIIHKGEKVITLDREGGLVVWCRTTSDNGFASLHDPGVRSQIPPRPSWCQELDGEIWAVYMKDEHDLRSSCSLAVFGFDASDSVVLKRVQSWQFEGPKGVPSGATIVPSDPRYAYMAHRSGHVSVWCRSSYELVDVQAFSHPVTAILGPSRYLWIGLSTGEIFIFDVSGATWSAVKRWKAIKRWRAHKGPVLKLLLDVGSLWSASSIRVISVCHLGFRLWDGSLANDWVRSHLRALQTSYSTYGSLRCAFLTYNVGAAGPHHLEMSPNPCSQALLRDFICSAPDPDMIVFGFQEVIDLSNLGLAADIALFASDKHEISSEYRKWRTALAAAVLQALGPDYVLMTDAKLVGLYTCIYVKRQVQSQLSDLHVQTVKAGFDAEYGNKGAIITNFNIADTDFSFVNAHCAAGEDNQFKRERDISMILEAKPPADVTVFAGDLNPRVKLPRTQVIDTVARGGAASLIPFDELTRQRKTARYPLASYVEQPLTFNPTYKYDVHTNTYDTSAKRRVPSWCDRILWNAAAGTQVKPLHYQRYEADISDHRPVSAAFDFSVRHVDLVKHERTRRQVLHEWGREQEKLLETCQDYYAGDSTVKQLMSSK